MKSFRDPYKHVLLSLIWWLRVYEETMTENNFKTHVHRDISFCFFSSRHGYAHTRGSLHERIHGCAPAFFWKGFEKRSFALLGRQIIPIFSEIFQKL